MSNRWAISLLLTVVVCGCGSGGSEEPPRDTPRTESANSPPSVAVRIEVVDSKALTTEAERGAYVLAVQDEDGDQTKVTNALLNVYKLSLLKLSGIYGKGVRSIVNMTLAAQKVMKRGGVQEEHIRVLRGMRMLNAGLGSSYSELISAYAVFRTKGETHEEAIEQLGALLDALEANKDIIEGR